MLTPLTLRTPGVVHHSGLAFDDLYAWEVLNEWTAGGWRRPLWGDGGLVTPSCIVTAQSCCRARAHREGVHNDLRRGGAEAETDPAAHALHRDGARHTLALGCLERDK